MIIIKMSGSESRPRKVELTCTHSKNAMTTMSNVHITMKPVLVGAIASLMAVTFSS